MVFLVCGLGLSTLCFSKWFLMDRRISGVGEFPVGLKISQSFVVFVVLNLERWYKRYKRGMVGLGDISPGFNQWTLILNSAMLIEHFLLVKHYPRVCVYKGGYVDKSGLQKFVNEHILNSNISKIGKITANTNKEELGVGNDKFLPRELEEISLRMKYMSLPLEVTQYFHSQGRWDGRKSKE